MLQDEPSVVLFTLPDQKTPAVGDMSAAKSNAKSMILTQITTMSFGSLSTTLQSVIVGLPWL